MFLIKSTLLFYASKYIIKSFMNKNGPVVVIEDDIDDKEMLEEGLGS